MEIVFLGNYCKDEIIPGPEKVAKRIYSEYTKNNKSIFIEYFFDGKKFSFFQKLFGKEEYKNENNAVILRLGVIRIFFLLLKINPKIIHILTFERFAIICFILKIFIKPNILYNVHGIMIHENKYFRNIKGFYNLKDIIAEDIIIKYSDILLVLSNNLYGLMKDYFSINKRKIKFIKNGVDGVFKNESEIIKKENNILKIVFISEINRIEKGFSFLKETLDMLDKEIELYIIDSEDVKKEIEFINNKINLICLNKMPAELLAEFLKDKDVFISASLFETFNISAVECMSAGLIPVITKETGISELIENGKNGFIFDYGNRMQLLNIINDLISNPFKRKSISEEASRIYSNLKWEKIFLSYQKIYEKFL